MNAFLGIDPGVSGGFGVFGGIHPEAHAFPETERDCWNLLCDIKRRNTIIFSVIEQVHAMPTERTDSSTGKIIRQGATSIFTFGRSYGFLRGLLIASGLRFQEVPPQTWQKIIAIKRNKGEAQNDFKNRLKARAQQICPHVHVTRATADALLLAYVARILWMNSNPRDFAPTPEIIPAEKPFEQLGLRGAGMGA